MLNLDRWAEIAQSLRPGHVGVVLGVLSLLLTVENRRFTSLVLLAQYIFFTLLLTPSLYELVIFARLAIALGICTILYITSLHVQKNVAASSKNASHTGDSAGSATVRAAWGTARLLFNLPALALAGLAAYSLWNVSPLTSISPAISLAGYWVIGLGLVTALVSEGSLRKGLGLMMIVSGFESLYLSIAQGLLVIGLLSVIDVMLALAIVYIAESWLDAQRREEGA